MNSPSYDPQALQDRLAFVGIDDATRATLRDLQSTVAASIGSALDAFYRKAAQHPHTKRFFANAEHIASAKRRQESHWEGICEARFDESFVKAVSAVGCIHAKLGLEPRWYIGGYSLIVEKLIEDVVSKRWPSRFGSKGSQKLAREIGALVKAAMLDMDYGISVYLEAIENERRAAADAKAKADQERQQAIAAFGRALTKLRDGDLTARLDGELGADFAAMAADYNDAVGALEDTIGSVVGSIGSIKTGLGEITVAAGDLSQRTEQQAASLEETVAALAEVTRGINDTAASAAQAQQTAQATQGTAARGGEIVGQAVAAMGEIETSSNKIGSIISVIDEIAFQTNLLALNAGVEAARAGEAGRGFAVVAQEVRGLAQRSAEAAKEIKDLIHASSAQVGRGVELVSASGRSLEEIVAGVGNLTTVVRTIAHSAKEQAVSLREVSTAADQMDKVTQQNAAMVEETTAAAQSLSSETQELAGLTERFRTKSGASGGWSGKAAVAHARPATAAPVRPTSAPVAQMKHTGTGGAQPKAQQDSWEEF